MKMDKQSDLIERRTGPRRGEFPPRTWFWILLAGWSLAVLSSLGWSLFLEGETVREHALHDADVHIEKTISFRKWAAEHGGVYVPATKRTPPNPHLSMIPDRDIETPGGKKLTLMNPSYMTRQLFELEDRVLNVRGHLTSLKPLRPENAADAWETEALKAFERGEKERAELNNIDGEDYMRVMRPLYVEKPCLKCHAQQGYEEGQVRGGISVSLPMAPLIGSAEPVVATMVFSHGLIWFIGLIGLVFSVRTVQGHTVELDNTARLLRESRDQLNRALTNSIQAVEKTVEARDPYTAGHQQRVAELSVLIAQEMGLEKERVDMIYLGASIHDIGKIRVPVEILSKPTRLTEHEYTLIQSHPQSGFDIIEDIDFPVTVKNIVLQHHERVDGLGYPQGLKGDEIDLEARIVAVADILEAMSSDRPYRPGKGMDAALDEVRRQRGVSLDADVVDASLKVVLPLKS